MLKSYVKNIKVLKQDQDTSNVSWTVIVVHNKDQPEILLTH